MESEEWNIEVPTPHPHISTSSDIFAIELDHWMRTIRVQIGTGDIVKQHTQAIVNPANSHLNHFGGVARAIADAAGNDLIGECEAYKQTRGVLPTAAVTHTTAGKLRPQIEYVIHTVGPRDVDYGDKDELQTILTKTYYSVINMRVRYSAYPRYAFRRSEAEYSRSNSRVLSAPFTQHSNNTSTNTPEHLTHQYYRVIGSSATASKRRQRRPFSSRNCTTSTSQYPHPSNTPIDMPTPTPSGRQAGRRRRANKPGGG